MMAMFPVAQIQELLQRGRTNQELLREALNWLGDYYNMENQSPALLALIERIKHQVEEEKKE